MQEKVISSLLLILGRPVTIHSVKRNARSRTTSLVLKENLVAGRY